MTTDSRPVLAMVAITCMAFGSAITFAFDHMNAPKPVIISDAVVAQPQPQFLSVKPGSSSLSQDPVITPGSLDKSEGTVERHRRTSPSGRIGSKKLPTSIIHLNTATIEELEELPGVGPSTAENIIKFRTQAGGFQSVDELGDIPRMGAKKLARLMPYVAL
jgi:competence ComEA-like helix-hairpin-helix protein